MFEGKVLLVGSSFSAVPILQHLRCRGLHISVCGAYPHDPCHALADDSFIIDYSNKHALLELVDQQDFDYLVPSCNDYAYLSCCWVAEQRTFCGYDDYQTALILHTKHAFREFTHRSGLPAPYSQILTSANHSLDPKLSYPLLVKPTDSFSGRGVTKVISEQQLEPALNNAMNNSRSNQALVEQFVDGSLHSHSAFIKSGQFVYETFADEFCTIHPYQVNCSNIPSSIPESVKNEVSKSIRSLATSLNLSDGLLHTQFIKNKHKFWIIECMRRCPGDLYGKMAELSEEVNYTDMLVRSYLGEALPAQVVKKACRHIGRHTVSTSREAIFTGLQDHTPGRTLAFIPLKNSGEILAVAPYDKVGILFTEFASSLDMSEHTPSLANHVKIESMEY
ncbi:ATP-grasp domain-containing protein [Methylophaga sp. OBS4]|uniref:ATP-grasp domain-containing protein n=1 Tax=Methylophaga sp. OBS4 TaxID=2991935 RepID=UPI002251DC5A|nr:ATP-grasp domain-containing protein [Methylophaga sp. OBS4]MCX4187364.1 ATP-grasp domain-containing protein [Methylophaga sp. OBS4]